MPPHSTFNLHRVVDGEAQVPVGEVFCRYPCGDGLCARDTKFTLRSCLLAHVKHVHGPFARRRTGGLTAAEMEEARAYYTELLELYLGMPNPGMSELCPERHLPARRSPLARDGYSTFPSGESLSNESRFPSCTSTRSHTARPPSQQIPQAEPLPTSIQLLSLSRKLEIMVNVLGLEGLSEAERQDAQAIIQMFISEMDQR
ncbi:hypothetical protein E4U13_003946 [Claviceps humidiphila]|uniref:Uncharacterized protein n=1 Tax=Claviceps humidiphila TaxID=1294629 RepID=A0A9P7PZ92_9HYPO|nr:hypothetical protein E4U13_003946 [Claviceps humidiphila]